MELYKYAVGELYNTTRTRWDETTDYRIHGNEHELRLFARGLTEKEVEGWAHGKVDIGALEVHGALFVLWRIRDAFPWSDQPFHWALQERAEPGKDTPQPMHGEQRPLLVMLLVDADTGILRAMRVVSLPKQVGRYIHEAVRRQLDGVFDAAAHDAAIAQAYRDYPESGDMVRHAIHGAAGSDTE